MNHKSNLDNKPIADIIENARMVCPFCKNTGIVKTVNLTRISHLPDGRYELNHLIEVFGEYYPCCEGCLILN